MLDGIQRVQARIAEIEARLANLRSRDLAVSFQDLLARAVETRINRVAEVAGSTQVDEGRVGRIQAYMRKRLFHPGLASHAADFVEAADRYGMDWRLGVALATVESSGGKNCFRPHNPFGILGRSFSSWKEAIYEVNRLVAGYGFGNDLVRILRKYNPSGGERYLRSVLSEMERI